MSNREYIGKFSKHLFWDVDIEGLDLDKHPSYVIPRVLEHGNMEDWRLINRYYGIDKIVEICKQLRSLDPVCLSFISAISHTNIEDYRCYHFRQSFPTLWNS
mgnify:CR=1 FL=1